MAFPRFNHTQIQIQIQICIRSGAFETANDLATTISRNIVLIFTILCMCILLAVSRMFQLEFILNRDLDHFTAILKYKLTAETDALLDLFIS